ncbi:hypothetical protein B566_EDAN013964 [Ephemera danica]|nr:hypothetical protein B566_EDAN013964 [Ephemera danica]
MICMAPCMSVFLEYRLHKTTYKKLSNLTKSKVCLILYIYTATFSQLSLLVVKMSKTLRALTLVTCKDNKMTLHEDVARKVLGSEKARNRPVAVISIAGMFRKGKSFFLNFILRYLKSRDDPQWIDSQYGHLEGFDWRPDHEGVTSGIIIWPEVFVVNNVAIVLIDTQGLYESNKNTVEDTYIMVLSFLFSSLQILNHQEGLNSTDLKNFEFFAKYGIALESKTTKIKGFQNLMFLIRDWKFENLHAYGLKSGNEYLDHFLKTTINEELHSVRETLKQFEGVDCFLMPYPGETVARHPDFKGSMKQIESSFLDNMKDLVEGLIANVKPKKLLGKEANGECVIQFMKNYIERLNCGDLPPPKSVIQTIESSDYKSAMEEKVKLHMHTLINDAERKCMTIYNSGMTNETKGKLLDKPQMDKIHKEFAAAALEVFDKIPKNLGYKELFETAKSQCSKNIEESVYKSTMEEKVKSHMKKQQNNAEKECMKIYNDGMTQAVNEKFLSNSEMDNLHKELAVAALKVFDNLQHFGHQDQLENAKLQCTKTIEAIREYKYRMEEKVKVIWNDKKECMMIYNDRMTNKTKDKLLNDLEMEKLHKECKSEALAVFDNLPHFGNQKQIENTRSQCSKKIEAISDFKTRMKLNVKMLEITRLHQEMEKCMDIYNENMKKVVENDVLKLSDMQETHKRYATAALEVFDKLSDFGIQGEVKTAKSKCTQSHMKAVENDAEKECMSIYNEGMKKGTEDKVLEKAEMDKLHNECAAEALAVFDSLTDFGKHGQIKNAKVQCSKRINASDYRNKMQEKVKSHMMAQQNDAEKQCMKIYNEGMKKGTENKVLEKAEMDKLHNECAAEALAVFDSLPDFGIQGQYKNAKVQCSKMEISTHLAQAKEECMESYNEDMRMLTMGENLDKSEMNKLHKESEAAALKAFDNLPDYVDQKEIKIEKAKCSKVVQLSFNLIFILLINYSQ